MFDEIKAETALALAMHYFENHQQENGITLTAAVLTGPFLHGDETVVDITLLFLPNGPLGDDLTDVAEAYCASVRGLCPRLEVHNGNAVAAALNDMDYLFVRSSFEKLPEKEKQLITIEKNECQPLFLLNEHRIVWPTDGKLPPVRFCFGMRDFSHHFILALDCCGFHCSYTLNTPLEMWDAEKPDFSYVKGLDLDLLTGSKEGTNQAIAAALERYVSDRRPSLAV